MQKIHTKNLVTAHQQQGTLDKFIKKQEAILIKSQANNEQAKELMARLALGAAYKTQNRKENLNAVCICLLVTARYS